MIEKYLLNKNNKNKEFNEGINKQNLEDVNINKAMNNKLSNATEKLKFSRKQLFRKNTKKILQENNINYNDLDEIQTLKLTKLNKFRSYVYTIIAQFRLNNNFKETANLIRIESLKHFYDFYKIAEFSISKWIINSTLTTYSSVMNFENLDLDISGNKLINSELNEKYLKLEIRLKNFLELILENASERTLDFNIIAFINIISHNGCVPFRFFSLFELSRLNIDSQNIIEIKDNQILMIITVFFIVKILIKRVLMEANIKNNFKIIASIYFHAVKDYFKSNCNINSIINNQNELINIQAGIKSQENQKEIINLQDKKGFDRKYFIAFKKFLLKKSKINENAFHERALFNKINNNLPIFGTDEDCDDIQFISRDLYTSNELQTYYTIAEQRNFRVVDLILEISNKILTLVK